MNIATIDFIAKGGDGYSMFATLPWERILDAQGAPIMYESSLIHFLQDPVNGFMSVGSSSRPLVDAQRSDYLPEPATRISF